MFSCTFSIDWGTCYLQIGKVINSYFQDVGPVPGDGSGLCHTVLCNLNKKHLLCDCWWQNGFPMHKNNLDIHHRKDRLGLLFLVPWSKTYLVTDILCGLCPSELPKENSNFQQTKRCSDLKYLSTADRVTMMNLLQHAHESTVWAKDAPAYVSKLLTSTLIVLVSLIETPDRKSTSQW